MSIRLYQFLNGTSGAGGYLAPSTYYPGIQQGQFLYPEFQNVSLNLGITVQVAVKLFSINNGTFTGVTGSLGARSQIFSIPNSMSLTQSESTYRDFFGIYVDYAGALHVQLNSTGGELDFSSSPGVITTGVWYRICISLTPGGVLTATVNNVQVFSQGVTMANLPAITYVGPIVGASIEPNAYGPSRFNGYHLDAEIESVWIWFTALNASDIASLSAGHSPMRLSAFPAIGIPLGTPTATAQAGTQNCFNSQIMSGSVYVPAAVGLPPIPTIDLANSGSGVYQAGASAPAFAPTHRGRERFAFPVIRQFGIGTDGARFTDSVGVKSVGNKPKTITAGARFFDHAVAGGKWKRSATDTATFHDNLAIRGHVAFAADMATFHGVASERAGVRASDSAHFIDIAYGGHPNTKAASDSAKFTDAASARKPIVHTQHVSDSFYFVFSLATVRDSSVFVAASDVAFFSDDAERHGYFGYVVDASDSAYVSAETVQAKFHRAYGELPPAAKARFSDKASATVLRIRKASASDSFRFADTTRVDAANVLPSMSIDAVRFTDLAVESRSIPWNFVDTATFTGAAVARSKHAKSASDTATFSDLASETLNKLGASGQIRASDLASASVLLAGGSVVPGGDQATGLRQILWPIVSTEYPLSFTESSDGYLLAANGVDAMVVWDGSSPSAWQAGIAAPESVVWLSTSGTGPLMGRRWAYLRYVDTRGNVSNLNQVSDPIDLGGDGFVEMVAYSGTTVTVRSGNHGLDTGAVVTITGVNGLPSVNGRWTITVVDSDSFTLDGFALSGGTYLGGGIWSNGVSQIIYSNVGVSQDPKVVRRQILRNLAGDASVFYVDVDTTDLTSTSFSSGVVDEQLATRLAVPILFKDDTAEGSRDFQGGVPAANRFGQPPSWKSALASYSGRIWAAADRVCNTGNASVTFGSPYVVGIGTAWTPALAGRLLYVPGCQPQAILSVTGQILTLETPYNGPSQVFAFYSIRPAPVERLLVYYSEPHTPEAWPPWNAFSVPETSDEITGLFVLKSFLYIAKERNVYKFAFKDDPGRDGYVFPTANRGCVNNRCYVLVESECYLLDEAGIYSFDGDGIEPVSQDVQVLFKSDEDTLYRVDWTTDRTFWHAVHDPARETIRWFLDLVGLPSLCYAICYDYRRKFWWLEQYPEAITSSALCVISNQMQPAVGTASRRVLCVGQGTTDLIPENAGGTLRGTSTGADSLSLSDATASFPSNLAGVPVSLVSGTGAGQQAIISSNTSTTLVTVAPWKIVPDTSTVYQIGGVAWSWKSGWRRFADDEAENPRDLEFVFRPTKRPSTFSVSLYYDHGTEAEEWGHDQDRDGIAITADGTSMVIDMATPRGYAIQRMSGHRDPYGYGNRFLALELNGVQGSDPQRVYQLVINGVE